MRVWADPRDYTDPEPVDCAACVSAQAHVDPNHDPAECGWLTPEEIKELET